MAMDNTPIQYINGFVEFYKLKFKVTKDVLIPRPETEIIVDEVLKLVASNNQPATILDIGTGAGVVAISIAKNLAPKAQVRLIATEISPEALKIAKLNAKFHHVADKIEFIQSDLLSQLDPQLFAPDIKLSIVTNLPYIPSERIPYLDSSVKDYEPHIALDGGHDGFGLYRQLFSQMKNASLKFEFFMGEIDYTHGELAKEEAEKYFPEYKSEVTLDLFHRQRYLVIKPNLT